MQKPKLNSKKFKKKSTKALSPLALLTLAACGGGGGDESVGLSFSTNENAASLLIGSVLSGSETVASSTYALSGEDADRFELSADGELSLKEPANYELQDSYEITIEVTTTTAAEVEGEESTVTTATRDYTVNVVNVNDPATGSLTVVGTPVQGETLTADTSAVSDEDGVGTISYQWYRDGELITGEVSSELTLTQSDVGKTISAAIEYTDGQGTVETVTSSATSAVKDVIVESIGAISAVNTGSGTNMVLEFYADGSLVGATITSFDAVVTFEAEDASYVSADIDANYLGVPNGEVEGVVNVSGISLSGGSSANPLFTITLTDQNVSKDLEIYVSDVAVNGEVLDGSTLLIA